MQLHPVVNIHRPSSRALLAAAAAATCLFSAHPPAGLSVDSNRDTVDVLVSQLDASNASVGRAVHRLGGTVVHRLSVIDGFAARVPARMVGVLASTPGVRWVTPNRSLSLESAYGENSGVASAVYADVVRATRTWSAGYNGSGVNVALVDTGVNTSGDLAGRVLHAEDFTSEQNNEDSYGHGTFVAGLIAGSQPESSAGLVSGVLGLVTDDVKPIKGVAPGSKLVSLKIAGRDGSTDVTRVLEALEWIVNFRDAYGIRVVNLSLGFDSDQSATVDPLDFAVERVWNAGVVVVAAAGNGGQGGGITTPGNDPMILTVGASDDKTTNTKTDDTMASFSSKGPTVDGVTKPDVVAPGRWVVSSRSPGSTVETTYPSSVLDATHSKGSGTSFSAAIASGAAALVIDRSWKLTPDQVKHRLVSTGRDLTRGTTAATGAGTLDAYAATMSNDLTAANAGLAHAQGGGSLQATRGPACLRGEDGQCMSDAEADSALGFDPDEYFSDDWAGSQWVGSQWTGSQWTGSQWTGSQWAGSQWAGSSDASKASAGSQWVGSQWVGSQWAGSQWAGSQWTQWASSPWSSAAWQMAP